MQNILHLPNGRREPAHWPRRFGESAPPQPEGWGAVAVTRGLWVTPDAGTDKCYAAEVAIADTGDENALDVRVIAVCHAKPAVYEFLGSGVCQAHQDQLISNGQIRKGGTSIN